MVGTMFFWLGTCRGSRKQVPRWLLKLRVLKAGTEMEFVNLPLPWEVVIHWTLPCWNMVSPGKVFCIQHLNHIVLFINKF